MKMSRMMWKILAKKKTKMAIAAMILLLLLAFGSWQLFSTVYQKPAPPLSIMVPNGEESNYTPTPTYQPTTPEPARGDGKYPNLLYLSMYPLRTYINEEIFGIVSCDLHDIDVTVKYGIDPTYADFYSAVVHIEDNGSGSFSVICTTPGTYYFTANYGYKTSNTVQVNVEVIG